MKFFKRLSSCIFTIESIAKNKIIYWKCVMIKPIMCAVKEIYYSGKVSIRNKCDCLGKCMITKFKALLREDATFPAKN